MIEFALLLGSTIESSMLIMRCLTKGPVGEK
jgi:hypothetical protein